MAESEEKVPKKVLVRAIIEMLGAPKEHIEKTLKDYIDKLKQDKEIEIVKEEYAPAEQQEKLFSVFVELDIRLKDAQALIDFCFDSMPSSVEIIEPEKMFLESRELSNTLNDMQAKLHRNDMMIKTLRANNAVLDANGKNILLNSVYYLVKEETQTIEYLSEHTGVKPEHLKPFLDEKIKKGSMIEKDGKYGRSK